MFAASRSRIQAASYARKRFCTYKLQPRLEVRLPVVTVERTLPAGNIASQRKGCIATARDSKRCTPRCKVLKQVDDSLRVQP